MKGEQKRRAEKNAQKLLLNKIEFTPVTQCVDGCMDTK